MSVIRRVSSRSAPVYFEKLFHLVYNVDIEASMLCIGSRLCIDLFYVRGVAVDISGNV